MTARTISSVSPRATASGRGLLAWVLDIDSAFRQRQALRRMDASALNDVGLGAADVRSELSRPVWDVPAHWYR